MTNSSILLRMSANVVFVSFASIRHLLLFPACTALNLGWMEGPHAPPQFERTLSTETRRPGSWSLGLEISDSGSNTLVSPSIFRFRFWFFAKLCNYLIQHHTPLIVFSMEMAPCHRDYMVCGCLHCNLIVAYYTIVVEHLPSSSSSWESLSKHYSGYNCRPMYSMGDV